MIIFSLICSAIPFLFPALGKVTVVTKYFPSKNWNVLTLASLCKLSDTLILAPIVVQMDMAREIINLGTSLYFRNMWNWMFAVFKYKQIVKYSNKNDNKILHILCVDIYLQLPSGQSVVKTKTSDNKRTNKIKYILQLSRSTTG
jgi:hypothetical protein